MVRWVWKCFLAEPWQFLASAAAVAGALLLVIFFQAVFAGETKQIVAFIEHSDADVWVMQRGVENMHMASSFVADWKVEKIKELEGVANVSSILYLNTVVRIGSGSWFSFIVGVDANDGRVSPWSVEAGKRLPGAGEILIPAVLARLAHVGIGDTASFAGRDFKVAGLTHGTFSMANSVTYVNQQDLAEVMSTFGSLSYVLVDAKPGVTPDVLAGKIEHQVDKVSAIPNARFIQNDSEVAMQMGTEIIAMMTVIGGALATLLMTFAVYSDVSRKSRELAIAKAIGFSNPAIYASVIMQAVGLALLGFVLAIIAMLVAVPLTTMYAPMVTLHLDGRAVLTVGLVAVFTAVFAAIVTARRTAHLDPMTAFRV